MDPDRVLSVLVPPQAFAPPAQHLRVFFIRESTKP